MMKNARRALGQGAPSPLLMLLLVGCVLIYNLHPVAMWAALVLLVGICCVGSLPALMGAYVFFFLFDRVLPLPLLGGSAVRLLQAGFGIRLLIALVRGRVRPGWRDGAVLMFVAASCIISFALKGLLDETLSFAVNMGIFLLLSMYLRAHAQDMPRSLEGMMNSFIAAVLTAGVYSLLAGRFLPVEVGGLQFKRFMGTYEPNFTAMFVNLAWLMWVHLPRRRNLKDMLVLGGLLATLALTVSLTGIGVGLLMGIIYLLMAPKGLKKGELLRFVRALPVALVLVVAVQGALMLLPKQAAVPAGEEGAASEPAVPPMAMVVSHEDYIAARDSGQDPMEAYRPMELEERTPIMEWANRQQGAHTNVFVARAQQLIHSISTGQWDALTSGRVGLVQHKIDDFAHRPLWRRLLGSGPDLTLTYMPISWQVSYTHNSFVDMLDSFGVIGLLIILIHMFFNMRKGKLLGVTVAGLQRRAVLLCRIALMLHMLTLSMHLNRVVLFFFF